MKWIVIVLLFLDILIKRKLSKKGYYLIEFPRITKKMIKKFTTFDAQLGWCPIPNSHKKNVSIYTGVPFADIYSIDAYGSRLLNIPFERGFVSTYGDSFCLCREAPENATFQAFLSKRTHSYVSNYGVGNYGLDQALLRMESQFLKDKTKHVIIAITPLTIERILSVWKHYSEPGNVLGAKPRFVLQNGGLKLIPNFIQCPDEFLRIKKKEKFLHQNDGNYRHFLKQKQKQNLSSLLYLATNKSLRDFEFTRISYEIAKRIRKNHILAVKEEVFLKASQSYIKEEKRKETIYLAYLYRTEAQLFIKLIERFINFSEIHKFVPHLLILPTYDHILFMREGNKLYHDVIRDIKISCPKLNIIDMYDKSWRFMNLDVIESLFVNKFGHHSTKGNHIISDVLQEYLSV
ncbi:MAG: hypothetical protein LBT69_03660 [Lactobacillales bacterium]|jgi:hypothetical protein|nr:hypothetical protein [Lactobacillales bacterium]